MAMNLFGLVDAENIPVAFLHYSIPAVILLYFIAASSVPTATQVAVTNTVLEEANGSISTSTPSPVRRSQPSHSNIVKWLFVLAVLTFVRLTLGKNLSRLPMESPSLRGLLLFEDGGVTTISWYCLIFIL
jgi:hypothetical protein